MEELRLASRIAASAMRAQTIRLRIVAENLANSESLAEEPGGLPYQRKVVTFRNRLDRELGVRTVQVHSIQPDRKPFERTFDPGNPAADADGYVLMPNVNPLIEMNDMREAQRTYQANLRVMSISREMLSETIELLRGR